MPVVPDIRNNRRIIRDDPALAEQFWLTARTIMPARFKGRAATGLNERFRLYRYTPGQYFNRHQDGCYRAPDGSESLFTLLIYLNEGFEGGGTQFACVFSPHVSGDFTIEPATGKAVIFHHPLSHRGDPVTKGGNMPSGQM